jgi:hypothetical protein
LQILLKQNLILKFTSGQIQGGILIAISGALEGPLEGGEKVFRGNT